MLKEFRVQGYRGFKDEIVWSFVPAGDYDFAPFKDYDAVSEGLIKSGIVFGKNGSGKSNLGYALFDIINHLVRRDDSYYDNFVYANHHDSLVKFTYLFLFDGQELEYKYSKTGEGLLSSEELIYAGKMIFKRSERTSLYIEEFHLSEKARADLDQGVNSVSIVRYLLSSQPLSEGHYLLSLEKFVQRMLWVKNLDSRRYMGTDTPRESVETFIIKNELIEDFESYMREVSGQNYTLKSGVIGVEHVLFCLVDEAEIPFSMIASTGTMALLLLYYWMKQIERQGVSFVFIDEFDAFFHFALSKAVCSRLFSIPTQIFLSSHNTALMTNDLLRPDCYFIIDGQRVRSLPQCTPKDLKWGHNLEGLYRGGAFSA